MSMNDRKMNNYSVIRVGSVLVLAIALVLATFTFPLGTRTGANPIDNNPPNEPNKPMPANGSINITITTDLSWTGGDPDEDPVTYDIYFGTTSPPSKKVANQSALIYDPGTMNYTTHYYWKIIAWDNQSASTVGPQWEFITESKSNNPPNTPSGPIPTNGTVNILLTAILSWTGGDPDGDTVKYDVYFGNTSSPLKVKSNQSTLTYDPVGLTYNTTYYWQIVAWDNHTTSATGPLWHFTTKQEGILTVIITKPLENHLYLQDQDKMSLSRNTIIYGPITITANVSSETDVAKVEFYVDGKLKETVTAAAAPYTYLWQPFIQFNGLSLKHTIKVIAYDTQGHNATAELNVTKWRFHVLPFIVAGAAIASRLLLHTTVTGLVFNLKESKIAVSFYAIRTHYKTIGPFKSQRGVINFKSCMGGILIGPTSMTRFGPLHKFAYGSFTILGEVHYKSGRLGQGILGNLLRNALTK